MHIHVPSTFSLCCATTVLDLICHPASTTIHLPVVTACGPVCSVLSLSPQVDAYTLPSERGKYLPRKFPLSHAADILDTACSNTYEKLTRSLGFQRAYLCPQFLSAETQHPIRRNMFPCRVPRRNWCHRSQLGGQRFKYCSVPSHRRDATV